jgi:hypothetical protein
MKNKPELKVSPDGTYKWYLNGKLARNGKLHRQDGSAVESPDGTREWWLNGHLHRQDGPAVELPDGTREWYLNGKEFEDQKDFLKKLEKTVSKKRFQEIRIREVMQS